MWFKCVPEPAFGLASTAEDGTKHTRCGAARRILMSQIWSLHPFSIGWGKCGLIVFPEAAFGFASTATAQDGSKHAYCSVARKKKTDEFTCRLLEIRSIHPFSDERGNKNKIKTWTTNKRKKLHPNGFEPSLFPSPPILSFRQKDNLSMCDHTHYDLFRLKTPPFGKALSLTQFWIGYFTFTFTNPCKNQIDVYSCRNQKLFHKR